MSVHRKAMMFGVAIYGNLVGWALYAQRADSVLWPLIPMLGGFVVLGLAATAVLRCPKCGEATYEVIG
jgi:hypothetical protein